MAILNRRGLDADFDAQKMLSGEMAVTTDGTRKVYAAFAPGDVKELASKEDVQNIVDDFTDSVDEKISEAVEQVTTEAEEQIAAVIQKGEEVLDSIPADYQEIAESVAQHDSEIAALTQSKSPAIICQASGETIIATDSSDKGFEQFRTYGGSKQETTSGNQLFDSSYRNSNGAIHSIGCSVTEENGVFTVKVTGTDPYVWSVIDAGRTYDAFVCGPLMEIPSGVTSIYVNLSNGSFDKNFMTVYDANKVSLGYITRTSNMSAYNVGYYTGAKYFSFRFGIGSTTVGETYETNVMINYGTEALPWEPYTGGIPSPNPKYQQPIVSAGQKLIDGVVTDVGISKKLTGKNLLDTTCYKASADYYPLVFFDDASVINKGNTYTVSVTLYAPSSTKAYWNETCGFIASKGFVVDAGTNRYSYTFTASSDGGAKIDGKNIMLSKSATGDGIEITATDFQIEEGTEATAYEPYTEQTLTINHVLRGIPLGTDIPEMFKSNALHMDGIYWNEKEQQYYIADTIDAERGVLVQRIAKYILTSDTVFDTNELATLGRVRITRNDAVHVGQVRTACLMCDSLTVSNVGNIYDCFQYEKAIIMYLGVDNTDDLATFMEGNTITIHYILATPIETPLTDEEIIAYKALHSNKPTTIITNDAGCFMEVEYVADTKTHIAQNYVPVTAFNNVLDRISALEQLHV